MDINSARQFGILPDFPEGSRLGARIVRQLLADSTTGEHSHRAEFRYVSAAGSWLTQITWLISMAADIDPADLPAPDGRGGELAREYMTTGQVNICCEHCERLMLDAIATTTVWLLRKLHTEADRQWDLLTAVLLPPPFWETPVSPT